MIKQDNSLIRVLLVDDDEDDYILTKYLFDDFKDNRYQLDWTSSYDQALCAMEAGDYNIYLVDYHLGAKNGLDLLRQAISDGCKAPIVLLTGQDDIEVDMKAMQAGAAEYLVKGQFEAELLERVIRYNLQHAKTFEKMEVSERKFRSVIQSASDAIFQVDIDGNIILWNKAATRIYGYEEDEILGKSSVLLMGEKYATRALEIGVDQVIHKYIQDLKGKTIYGIGRRKDGSEFPVEMSGSVWNEKGGFFYTAIVRDITESEKARHYLKESEEKYRDLFENANDIIYLHDLKGNFISINQAGTKVFGYTPEEAKSLNISEVVVAEQLDFVRSQIMAKMNGKESSNYELQGITKDGKKLSFEVNSRIIFEGQKPVAVQGIARDITDRKLAEEERDRLYNFSNDLLATISFSGQLLHFNPAWEKILGYSNQELLEMPILEMTHEEDKPDNLIWAGKLKNGESVSFESRMVCKDGSHRWILWNSTPVVTNEISYAVGRDITDRKRTEEVLQFNANYDLLTGLPNRTQFMNYLQNAITEFQADPAKAFAVLFLDLDRFKVINDGLGHLIGDKLLVAIAQRMSSCLRAGDIVARLGGDEFTILVHNSVEVDDASIVSKRILEALSRPFRLENYEVFSSASIGIVLADETLRKPEDFLRDADTAMYRAKAAGKACYEFFDREMHANSLNLLQIENDLRHVVERNELRVYFQPIFDLKTTEIVELEALIRWEHPEKGLIPPSDFIPLAEETGLIVSIGKWVLEESCRQLASWHEKGLSQNQLSVSVNLSAKQLMHSNITEQIKGIIEKTGINPSCLKLEITESAVMENAELALEILTDIWNLGVKLSSDDFGTGYSSLSYLHRFPFDQLKIDRSFVNKMDDELKSEGIVKSIILLAKNLNMEVVAEGIETEKQFRQLHDLGCKLGQGYFFSKPVKADDVEELLANGVPKLAQFDWLNSPPVFNTNGTLELAKIQ